MRITPPVLDGVIFCLQKILRAQSIDFYGEYGIVEVN